MHAPITAMMSFAFMMLQSLTVLSLVQSSGSLLNNSSRHGAKLVAHPFKDLNQALRDVSRL